MCTRSLCEQGWDGKNDILILKKRNVICILLWAECPTGLGQVFFFEYKRKLEGSCYLIVPQRLSGHCGITEFVHSR